MKVYSPVVKLDSLAENPFYKIVRCSYMISDSWACGRVTQRFFDVNGGGTYRAALSNIPNKDSIFVAVGQRDGRKYMTIDCGKAYHVCNSLYHFIDDNPGKPWLSIEEA